MILNVQIKYYEISQCYTVQKEYLMAYIKDLMDSLFGQENQGNIESFKKLIYLSVNETALLQGYALDLAQTICPILHCIEDTTTKIYALQLLSQLATNYKQRIPAQTYDFSQVVGLLSDENPEVRKASHYLLLIFVKKYELIDPVINAYYEAMKKEADQWKQIQKIIHSFQSLLVIQPRSMTFVKNINTVQLFLNLLLPLRVHTHPLIVKATQQAVCSFLKNQDAFLLIPKFKQISIQHLSIIAEKNGIVLPLKSVASTNKKQNMMLILLQKIQKQNDWKIKSQVVQEINKKLQIQQTVELPQNFIESILDLTYDYNFKICITAMGIVHVLVTKFMKNVKQKIKKIEDVMIQKICDLKMAVRQIAVKILKNIYSEEGNQNIKKLLTKLSNCSVIGKQQILNFIQEYFTNNNSMQLPILLTQIAAQLSNENTKIKIKSLDCLVKIAITVNIQQAKYILQKKLNKRLRQRLPQKSQKIDKWDDLKNNNLNKGMTWQAERNNNIIQQQNNKFLTKIQFGKKPQKQRQFQEDTFYDFKYQAPTFGGVEKIKQKQQGKGLMLGTSHTSNQTYSTFDRTDPSTTKTFNKKLNEGNRSNLSSNTLMHTEQYIQQKKLPLKPKPVKKVSQVQSQLVIQSKQYQNKVEQTRQQKVVKPIRINNKKQQNQKQKSDQQPMPTAKQPFVIKKVSRKQHQIDYKATQYVSKQELAPVNNPKQLLKDITTNLPKDNDWSKQFDCLDGLRRIIKNHQDFYPQVYQSLPLIVPEVLKLIESLRSSLSKNAMITLAQMCESFKKAMDLFLQAIFIKLFKKSQDTNTFIIEQVNKCVKSLCNYCSVSKIIGIITNNCQAKAIPIKLKVAFTLQHLLQREDYSLNVLRQYPKIIGVMGSYISDSSQEVRAITKQTFISLCTNNGVGEVEGMFKKSPKDQWQKWKNIIDKEIR